MKLPSLEDAGGMFMEAVQYFVKELEEILENTLERLRDFFGELR